jgi:small-conductance mechanosensitive channel
VRLKYLPSLLLALGTALALRVSAETPPADQPVSITVRGREVAVLRVRLLGYAPKERAIAAGERIRQTLDAEGPGTVTLRELPEGRMVELDGKALFVLTSGDANALAGETLETVTAEAAARLRTIVAESREGRDVRRLLSAIALGVLATAIAGALLLGISRIRRRAERALDAVVQSRLETLKRTGVDAVPREHVTGLIRMLVRAAVFILGAALVLGWLDFVLTRFPFTRPLGEKFADVLRDAVGTVGAAIVGMIPGLLVVVIIFFLTRFLARLLEAFFRRIETGEVDVTWLEPELAVPTRKIALGLLWIFAVVMAYPYLPGSGSEAFKGISVLVGLMISLGSTSLVGQAASGLMLLYSRTVRVGEWVRIGEHEGLVTSVGMLATRLKTGLGDEKILPNNVVVGTTTHNYSRFARGRGHLVEASVTIGYGEPWRQVEGLLLLAADRTPDVRKEPKPFVIQRALSDFYVEYQLNAYTDESTRRLLVLSELHRNIQDAFNEFGVQIMSPHYRGDKAQPVVVPKEKWHLPPAPPPGKPPEG